MRIKKTSQTTPVQAEVVNTYSESQENAYSCDYINDRNTYSTSEVNTGKTWIDGKPIYRKVFTGNFGSITGGTYTNNDNDISSLNMGQCIKIEGNVNTSSGFHPFLMLSGSGYIASAIITTNKTNLRIRSNNNDYSNLDYICILEYTKTS